jgi:hypothetical protein
VHVLLLLWYACRTEDTSWDVLDSVFVTIAKGAPAGKAHLSSLPICVAGPRVYQQLLQPAASVALTHLQSICCTVTFVQVSLIKAQQR